MIHTDQTGTRTPDTLLIFEQPKLYFFPALKDSVYPTFRIPQRSLRYLIYKLLYVLHLPGTHLFWGEWTKRLAHAKRVIIFDYGYQRGMERYIRRVNPDCEVSLFFWNMITPQRINHKLFTDKSAIYSTDPADCARYHFRYNSMFYTAAYRAGWQDKNHSLFFIGQDKGRAADLLSLHQTLSRANITCDIRIVSNSKDPAYIRSLGKLYFPHSLSYPEYLAQLDGCDILLDINQRGQQALTMRVMESIFLSKKLITNNAAIREFDFYNENNILLLPENLSHLTAEMLSEFLKKPFLPYSEEVLGYYDFEAWKMRFAR